MRTLCTLLLVVQLAGRATGQVPGTSGGAATSPGAAPDVVLLKPRGDAAAATRLSGEIVDYTGAELRIKVAGGKQRSVPAEQVARVIYPLSEAQRSGDERFAAGDFKGALAQYGAALGPEKERRPWVRRQLAAQMVWCLRNLGQIEQAGQIFLQVLLGSDEHTPYFDCLPLAWTIGIPSPTLERTAQAWLANADSPAATLLGASQLLSTAQRPAALTQLQRLSADKDPRIRWLAQAQIWRTSLFQAHEEQLLGYLKAIDDCPEALRAGPYFVAGSALVKRRPKEAALALLRVPIEYPRERQLASLALLTAGRALQQVGQDDEAGRLYREVVGRYRDLPEAAEAQQRLPSLAGAAAALPAGGETPEADSAQPATLGDERFLAGLRARRLFGLAELYCRQRLAEAELPDVRRAELVSELSRTLAAQAVESPPQARAPLWKAAAEAIDEFRTQHPGDPRLLQLDLQKALNELAAGELARQEADVSPAGGDAAGAARVSLRQAINQLQQLDEQLTAELQRRTRITRAEPGQWSVPELVSLQATTRYQLARAFRNQALTYPADSSDRLNALTQAAELLEPLAQLVPETDMAWLCRLDDIVCHRLLRDFAVVERKLAAVAKEEPPPAMRARFEAERIRSLLDRREVDKALVAAGSQPNPSNGPDFNFAQLEAFVAGWRDAAARKQTAAAARWERAAGDQVRLVEQSFGPAWMRRAETLLAGAIAATPGSESLDTLVRAAESYYRGGKYSEAVAAYDRAIAQAKAAQDAERVFELAFTAAAIEHQAGHLREALDRYRSLALSAPAHAKASQAHLLAAYDAAQLTQQQPAEARAATLAEFQQLLEEHLRTWPEAPTAGQAAWWLGQLQEQARSWSAAVNAYKTVPPGHAQFAAAVEATARCYDAWLEELRLAGTPDERMAADAAHYFESLVIAPSGNIRQPWTPAARVAALAAARLWLEDARDGQVSAEEVLVAALSVSDNAPPEWLRQAQTLLVRAHAAAGRFGEATQTAARLAGAPAVELLGLAEALARDVSSGLDPQPRGAAEALQAYGPLQLKVLNVVDAGRDKLAGDERRQLDRLRAVALANAGRRDQGLAILEKMAGELPDDGPVHETLAQLLSDGDTESRKQALVKWREVQRKSRPGSARWFRANYGLARTFYLLGNKVEAHAIIRLVSKARPDLGGVEMKSRFERLRAECER